MGERGVADSCSVARGMRTSIAWPIFAVTNLQEGEGRGGDGFARETWAAVRSQICNKLEDKSVVNQCVIRSGIATPSIQSLLFVLVQPEMERGRFPLVSNPPFRARSL
jgi:hypothetical protein